MKSNGKIKRIWFKMWHSPTYLEKRKAIEEIEGMTKKIKRLFVNDVKSENFNSADNDLKALLNFIKSRVKIIKRGLNWKQ